MKLILALLISLPFAVSAQEWLLTPVNIVDVKTGQVSDNQAVLINDGRITRITAAGDADPGLPTVDGQQGFLIPGLAEMHAHVPAGSRGDQYLQDVLDLFLANGITTIRGMLGEPSHLSLREALASGQREGPQLVTSGPSFNGRTVSSSDQGADRVHEQYEAGYDFLKIHPGLEREEFINIAGTAHGLGLPIAGHVSHQTGLNAALEARQNCIDHLDGYAQEMLRSDSKLTGQPPQWFGLNLAADMDAGFAEELAQKTAAAGVWNAPTQSLFETTAGEDSLEELLARPGMDMLSKSLSEQWQNSIRELRAQSTRPGRENFLLARRSLILELQKADAGLLLGSDAPQIMNVPGFSTHQELEYLVGAGLSPLQALQTGTVNVARYFELADHGEVMEGFVADLVLLGANPLEDISHTAEILGVARGGRWYTRQELNKKLQGVKSRGL